MDETERGYKESKHRLKVEVAQLQAEAEKLYALLIPGLKEEEYQRIHEEIDENYEKSMEKCRQIVKTEIILDQILDKKEK